MDVPAYSVKMVGQEGVHFKTGLGGANSHANYGVGEEVEVYSKSKECWLPAKVNATHRDGTCDIRYTGDGSIKQVPLEDQASKMRHPKRFVAGQPVEVLSQSRNCWLEAKIHKQHENGSVDIEYTSTGEKKHIYLAEQASQIRLPARDGAPYKGVKNLSAVPKAVGSGPMPPIQSVANHELHFDRGAGGGLAATKYNVNDIVKVSSDAYGVWVHAKVSAVHRDGSIDVKYNGENSIKQIPLSLQPAQVVYAQ